MHIIITRSGLSIGKLLQSADGKCHNNDVKTCFYPLDNWQGIEKASPPLNGYVAVFSIEGKPNDGNYGNVPPRMHQIHTFGGKHVSSTTRRTIKQVMDILISSTSQHGNVAQPNLVHPKVEHRQIKPESEQDLMCCDIQRYVRLTRGPSGVCGGGGTGDV